MNKPVIILGGGLMGSLLAYRLKQIKNEVSFVLYEQTSSLGGNQMCSFRESDCEGSMSWLIPLISHTWKDHQIKFPTFEKWITNPYHLINPTRFHEFISGLLGENLRLNYRIGLEQALEEGSYVIDTRNLGLIGEQAFKKYLIWEVHLADDHHLIAPVIFDAGCVQKDHFRKLHYMPTGPRNLIIKDEWFSDDKNINHEEMIRTLSETMKIKGWKINKVMREEIGVQPLPTISGIINEERRVINLSGLSHELTGCSISGATKLIDKLVSTSFRYGEVKEVVKTFKAKREGNRKFLLYLNRQLIHHHQTSLFADIYSQPYPVLERFSKGTLSFFDRSRIALGHRSSGLAGLFDFKMLNSICHVFLIEHKTHSKGMSFVGE